MFALRARAAIFVEDVMRRVSMESKRSWEPVGLAWEGASVGRAGETSSRSAAESIADSLEVFRPSHMLAVQKTRTSVSRKRKRMLDTSKQLKNIQHFAPCPGCKEGYLKLRHHLCVCRMRELGLSVRWRDIAQYNVVYRKPSGRRRS